MLNRIACFLTSGNTWRLKCWLLCVVASLMFSCAPAIWMFPSIDLPPAYQLKSESPLADTATLTVPAHEGERSHGAKLTPRLLGSFFLYASTSMGRHPYFPATIGGLMFLLSGVVVGYQLTGNRLIGLSSGLLLAGLYASNACFSMNHGPKPFDGVAIGMVALTLMLINRPWLFAISAYLACWSDERAIVSLMLIGALVMVRENLEASARQAHFIALAVAVLGYGLSRMVASHMMEWTDGDTSMLGDNLIASLSYAQMVAWTCFEGGWVLIGVAAWMAHKRGNTRDSVVLIGSAIFAMGTCFLVLDLSRAAAFSFPVIFIAIAVMQKHAGLARNIVVRTTGIAAAVSLLASNVEIIASIAFSPLPSMPIVWWLRWTA